MRVRPITVSEFSRIESVTSEVLLPTIEEPLVTIGPPLALPSKSLMPVRVNAARPVTSPRKTAVLLVLTRNWDPTLLLRDRGTSQFRRRRRFRFRRHLRGCHYC